MFVSRSPTPYFRVEPNELESATCPCCAADAGWRGYVYGDGGGAEIACAVYGIQDVSLGRRAMVRLWIVTGRWDGQATSQDRVAGGFSVTPARSLDEQPTISQVEMGQQTFHDLVALASSSNHPSSVELLTCLARAIVAQDPRLAGLRRSGGR